MKFHTTLSALALLLLMSTCLVAQDKEAKITLHIEKKDTVYVCSARVTSADSVVTDVSVKLFIQRMFSLLTVGRDATTNEEGIAHFNLPSDIPCDLDGKLTVVAKIEDDENYVNTETKTTVDWPVKRAAADPQDNGRALWASRDKAPIYLILASNIILIGIWGTLIYVITQIFRLKKIAKRSVTK